MDEFLEQMLSASSWGDGVGISRASWDTDSGNGAATDSSGVPQNIAKLSSMPLMSSGRLGGMLEGQGLGPQNRTPQDGAGNGLESENAQYISNNSAPSSQFERRELHDTLLLSPNLLDSSQVQCQETSQIPLHRLAEGTAAGGSMILQLNTASSMGNASQGLSPLGGLSRGPPPLVASSLLGSNTFEGSGFQQPPQNLASSPLIAPTWHRPYIGGMPPLPTTLGQGKPETFSLHGEALSSDAHLGKRSRDDEEILSENRQTNMGHVAQSLGLQSGQVYGDQMPLGHNEATIAVVNGAGRPRVRARRGQATDPHSIAERNRRERIAERMKALQELVPDSNKTDKASMLDEIINYVKFLQMQVKCLSLCRLGGAGAAAPLFTEFPSEGAGNFVAATLAQANGVSGSPQDGMAYAERQVARLMDEDMSAAMQYLQSKGLCLMPISLATAISSTGARQQSGTTGTAKGLETGGSDKQQQTELQTPAAIGSSGLATVGSSDGDASGSDSASKVGASVHKGFKGIIIDDTADEKVRGVSITAKGGTKNREESQR